MTPVHGSNPHVPDKPSALPFSAGTDRPRVAVPVDACDCHMHVYDQQYPAAPGARLLPPDAFIDDCRQVQARLGTTRTVQQLNRARFLSEDPAVVALAERLSVTMVGGTPQQLGDLQRVDSAKWAEVIRKGNIKAD